MGIFIFQLIVWIITCEFWNTNKMYKTEIKTTKVKLILSDWNAHMAVKTFIQAKNCFI